MADEEKQPLTRDQMAAVLAQHIGSGWIVNLGIGIPTLVSNFLYPEQEITLHSENGVIGYGRVAGEGEEDPDTVNASAVTAVTLDPGAAIDNPLFPVTPGQTRRYEAVVDVEVVDILRDKANLEFRRDSEAKVVFEDGELVVERFYPMNLLQKLSMQKETVEDWRELVESVLIDWNYDGAVLQPAVVDIPGKTDLVAGRYEVPADAGTIRVKITDLLSESWEGSVTNG